MKKQILSIFTRTPLHVGAGNSVGAIDSPVMRERHTRIPIIPGSSLKGVLADLWNEDLEEVKRNDKIELLRKKGSTAEQLFGQVKDEKRDTQDFAGQLLVGEARVLAFPVRSAKGSFAWITCPLALRRLERDAGWKLDVERLDGLTEDQCVTASDEVKLTGQVVLEEYQFTCAAKDICEMAEKLAGLGSDPVWKEVESRLVVVNDEMFTYFVEQACEVVSRIRIDDKTGTVAQGALFNQEQVPSETMFYAVLGAQDQKNAPAADALGAVAEKLNSVDCVLQIGGDETIGLGYCTVTLN